MNRLENIKVNSDTCKASCSFLAVGKALNLLRNKHNTEYFSLVDLTSYESIKCSQEK